MTDNAIARARFDNDLASKALGIEIVELSDGYAKTAMTVTDQMVNGHAITHGGYVFIVADTTFALACNSYDGRCAAHDQWMRAHPDATAFSEAWADRNLNELAER